MWDSNVMMYKGLQLLLFLCVASAIYQIIQVIFHVPSSEAVNGIMNYDYPYYNEKMDTFTRYAYRFALRWKDKFPKQLISEYKVDRLNRALSLTGKTYSAEIFVIMNIYKSVVIIIGGSLVAYVVMPWFVLLAVYLGIKHYFDAENQLLHTIQINIRDIDEQLPLFVSSIAQEFTINANVYETLYKYTKTAGTVLRRELEITVAEMRTGNYEQAIINLNERVGSEKLSDVCYYLLSTIRGNNNVADFSRLAAEFRAQQQQDMKNMVNRIPKKLQKYNWGIFAMMFVIMFYALFTIMMQQLGEIF